MYKLLTALSKECLIETNVTLPWQYMCFLKKPLEKNLNCKINEDPS